MSKLVSVVYNVYKKVKYEKSQVPSLTVISKKKILLLIGDYRCEFFYCNVEKSNLLIVPVFTFSFSWNIPMYG